MAPKPHADMVGNILTVYGRATMLDLDLGSAWYEQAHADAERLGEYGDISTATAAAVIAAVSPRMRWAKNLALAIELVSQYQRGEPLSGYLRNGLDLAQRLLDGADPWEVLTGQKRRAFFECIIHAGQTDMVCVDRHAMSIAYGFAIGDAEQGMTPRQYSLYADAYQHAARQLGIPAAHLQAITWKTWRRERGITD